MDRRRFLGGLGAAPFLFGLEELFAQEDPVNPEWLKTALADMKERGQPALVVVLPWELPERASLGRALWKLLTTGGPAAHALFFEADFLFLSPAIAQARFDQDARVGHRLLLDPEGKVIARGTWDAKGFESAQAFVQCFGPFLRGEKLERLLARDRAERAKLSQEVLDALGQLDHESPEVRDAASALLAKNITAALPCLAHLAATTTKAEEKARTLALIEKPFQNALSFWRILDVRMNRPRAPLPYGIERSQAYIRSGCGVPVAEEAPEGEPAPKIDWERAGAVTCGMGSVDNFTRTFVKFLSK